jgi:branched-chain amino acid transport system substrate-binding protein
MKEAAMGTPWTASRRTLLAGTCGLALLALLGLEAPAAAEGVLKVGVLGVMSGPAASWGLVNRYCAEAAAQMFNEEGGFEIDGEPYRVQIVSIDDRNDPKVSVAGAERLIYQEGIRYIIGPNVDTTAAAIVPVVEKGGAINIPYAFSKSLYTPPRENSILGMIASYQAGPVIYKHLMENEDVQTVNFIARNESDPLNQRDEGVEAAKGLGLEVLSSNDTYEPGTTDFFPVMSRLVQENPDLIVLSGVAPADAPLLIRTARELGYQGLMSTETAQDAKVLQEVAGELANGFISVGGASTPAIRSPYMEAFIDRYVQVAGEWNDEAGTKVYALEMILNTIAAAGGKAVDDIEPFKAEIEGFEMKNPFLKEEKTLKYVGSEYFQQPRQIGVPMVVNVFKDGEFETLFVGSVEA